MSITEKLLDKVSFFLKENGITGEDKIQIGFSGGPDSTVLFFLLKQLQSEFKYSLYALYVDHGIRPFQIIEREIEGVKKTASFIGGSLLIERIPTGKIEKEGFERGRSIEDLAREYRYGIYETVMKERGASYTALGHNLDDNAETLVMRMFQGSGIHGLSGIPPARGKFIRPLLEVDRKSIERCATENDLEPVLDETNNEPVYLRNRVRKELLPVVEKLFPGYRRALVNLAGKMSAVSGYARIKTGDLTGRADTSGCLNVSADEFATLTAFERMELLYESWDVWKNKPSEKLSYRTIETVIKGRRLPAGRILLSANDYSLERRGDMIFWNRLVVLSKKSYLRVISSGSNVVLDTVRIEVVSGTVSLGKEEDIWVDSSRLKRPLVVRSRKSGDYIDLSGGRKKIKKLYGEWKVPEEDRWRIPLIADRNGIIAVLGKPFGYRNRVAAVHKAAGKEASGKTLIFKAYME